MVQRSLTGFAAGVMVAASVWNLLVPAMGQAEGMGRWAFLPAVIGFWLGVLFLLVLDRTIPHLHQNSTQPEGPHTRLKRTTMLVLAVTLHNIPEGMAVGVVLAGWMAGDSGITAAGTLALSLGIALQNFPERAIISMPLRAEGMGKGRAFLYGVLSGIVEPLAAILTMLAAGLILPALPYLLSFAADMDAWYKCHLAFILPIVYLNYALDCNFKQATRKQIEAGLQAVREGYGLLQALGYPILPEDTMEKLHGLKGGLSYLSLRFMAKTTIGELAATDHCHSAVMELEALDRAWEELRIKAPHMSMPNWDALRTAMPPWVELAKHWGKKG